MENNNVALFAKKLQTGTNLIYGSSTILTNCDNVTSNVAYRLNYAVDATTIPQNTPYGSTWKSTNVAYFQSNVQTESVHTAGDQQLFIGSDGVYSRHYGASWTSWVKVADRTPENAVIVVDKNGNGDFTSLCEAILYAYANYENAYVYVKRGTYDAIEEMKAKYGQTYFDNMTDTAAGSIYLQNGIHIYCEPGTVMTCHYTGDNNNVMIYFSPINFRRGKATIENLTILASRVRYCIHDDQWDSDIPYVHILKNCRLEIDNTENTAWDRRQAFGGGLGQNGHIEFDCCYFKAAGLDGTAYTGYASCSYHNSPSVDAYSEIYLKNCYFADNSTFAFTYYGESELVSKAFVSGCSLGRAMQTGPEGPLAQINNIEIIDCNNVVRT